MIVTISEAHNEARLEGTRSFIDTGPGNGRIRIYDSVETLLVEVQLEKPCGTVDAGALTLALPDDALISATGIAHHAEIINGASANVLNCDVTNTAGDGFIKLANTQLYAGGLVRLTVGTLT